MEEKNLNKLDNIILSNLIYNETYYKKVIGYIKAEYFDEPHLNIKVKLFNFILEYEQKYDKLPCKNSIEIDIIEKNINSDKENISSYINENLIEYPDIDYRWLVDKTENWCKERAIIIALGKAIDIVDGSDETAKSTEIPVILQKALSVSFDHTIGHSYNDDYLFRLENRKRKHKKIPYDIDNFNEITQGGLNPKTLTIIVAGTGVGKSLFMCHQATSCLRQGYNVLYITCEMAEESIADRIDSNLLGINIRDLPLYSNDDFVDKFRSKINKIKSKLYIKEYPTSQGSVSNFEFLLTELEYKKKFKPDIMFIDYINICSSVRSKDSSAGSYFVVKSIAEEIRGLAVRFNIPIVTATQSNRGGQNKPDMEITDVSESHGIAQTADFMFALISTNELEQQNKLLVKQFKNRYNDINYLKQFNIAVDKSKMKIYNSANMYANPVPIDKNLEEYTKLIHQLG